MKTKTITVTESAQNILNRVGNASSYISKIVELRWNHWQRALNYLERLGLGRIEILELCYARIGLTTVLAPCGEEIARQIVSNIGDGGHKHLSSIRRSHNYAWAIVTIVQEYWAGNQELRERLNFSL